MTAVLRFAPSPNGELHLGHALSALIGFRWARRLGGRFLVRIEDIDIARSRPEFIASAFEDLAWLGIEWEQPVLRQSEHFADYADAAARLEKMGLLYPCFATRSELERASTAGTGDTDPDGVAIYPGLYKGLPREQAAQRKANGEPYAMRLDMERAVALAQRRLGGEPLTFREFDEAGLVASVRTGATVSAPSPLADSIVRLPSLDREGTGVGRFPERNLPDVTGLRHLPTPHPSSLGRGIGAVNDRIVLKADPSRWGDAVIVRKDTPTSYHLSVVIDDARQGITHVTRGRDLYAATDLQRLLQVLLELPGWPAGPLYHHHRLIADPTGRKLAKSARDTSLRSLREQGWTVDDVHLALELSGSVPDQQ